MNEWTIQRLLNWMTEYLTQKGVDAPRLSAELLLSHVLGLKRIELYTQYNKVVAQEQLDRLRELVKRAGPARAGRLPRRQDGVLLDRVRGDARLPDPPAGDRAARAAGHRVPAQAHRPAAGLRSVHGLRHHRGGHREERPGRQGHRDGHLRARTGRGGQERREIRARRTGSSCVTGTSSSRWCRSSTQFDLIACNPPYVSAAEYEALDKNVKDYEPRIALYAGQDGLDVYRRIVEKVGQFLKPDGILLLEIGYTARPRRPGVAGTDRRLRPNPDRQRPPRPRPGGDGPEGIALSDACMRVRCL